jgi:hypothetical protein
VHHSGQRFSILHARHTDQIRLTPPGEEIMLTLPGLELLVGHIAGEANHAKDERLEALLSGFFERIEDLLDTYAEED